MNHVPNWRELLQLAPNVKTVNAIMADFVESIRPMIGALPASCESALAEDLDIQTVAVELLHAELHFEGSGEAREFLREVAHTFAAAAVRVTALHANRMTAD